MSFFSTVHGERRAASCSEHHWRVVGVCETKQSHLFVVISSDVVSKNSSQSICHSVCVSSSARYASAMILQHCLFCFTRRGASLPVTRLDKPSHAIFFSSLQLSQLLIDIKDIKIYQQDIRTQDMFLMSVQTVDGWCLFLSHLKKKNKTPPCISGAAIDQKTLSLGSSSSVKVVKARGKLFTVTAAS